MGYDKNKFLLADKLLIQWRIIFFFNFAKKKSEVAYQFMAKNKLRRFDENATFPNLIQSGISYPPVDHELKGRWKNTFFGNDNPIVLELGCGRGEYATNLAKLFPEKNFIGIDWKGARLWRGAKTGIEEKIGNVAFLRIQIQNISSFFSQDEVDEIWITFPDPQILKTGVKKRLTSPRFLNLYRRFMVKDGVVNLKTDSRFFYDYTAEVIKEEKLEVLIATDNLYEKEQDEVLSIKTTYEKMWLKDGARICYLRFRINSHEEI